MGKVQNGGYFLYLNFKYFFFCGRGGGGGGGGA